MSVFLSHSSKDKPFVRRLKGDLESLGYEAWLDEKVLEVGDNLSATILSGIHRADWFFLVISSSSMSSSWVAKEIQFALDTTPKRKSLGFIPILIDGAAWPHHLPECKYFDFRNDYGAAFSALTEHLSKTHCKVLWNLGKRTVLTARRGLPFDDRRPHRVQTTSLASNDLSFTLLLETVGFADAAAACTNVVLAMVAHGIADGQLMAGKLAEDVNRLFLILDAGVRTFCEQQLGTSKPVLGAKCAFIVQAKDDVFVYSIGGCGGFLISQAGDAGGKNLYLSRVLDAKCELEVRRPGRDIMPFVLDAPLGHIHKLSHLEPRGVRIGTSGWIAVSNFIVSPEHGERMMSEAVEAQVPSRVAERMLSHGAKIARAESRPECELMCSVFSWAGGGESANQART